MADYDEYELQVMAGFRRRIETAKTTGERLGFLREAQFLHEIKARLDARIVPEPTPLAPRDEGPLCSMHDDFWLASGGRKVCRVCHPPAPGAEQKEE